MTDLPSEERPTIDQVAWVFRHLAEHIEGGGSYRQLIYGRLGFGKEAYVPLYKAGGMAISNALFSEWEARQEALKKDDD